MNYSDVPCVPPLWSNRVAFRRILLFSSTIVYILVAVKTIRRDRFWRWDKWSSLRHAATPAVGTSKIFFCSVLRKSGLKHSFKIAILGSNLLWVSSQCKAFQIRYRQSHRCERGIVLCLRQLEVLTAMTWTAADSFLSSTATQKRSDRILDMIIKSLNHLESIFKLTKASLKRPTSRIARYRLLSAPSSKSKSHLQSQVQTKQISPHPAQSSWLMNLTWPRSPDYVLSQRVLRAKMMHVNLRLEVLDVANQMHVLNFFFFHR